MTNRVNAQGKPLFIRYRLFENALEQPHLLIAGATGSGKSVVINGLIYTALLRSASKAQFILIDPKRVELSVYKNLPHVLRYASEPLDMISALCYAMDITEQRYKEMQRQGVRKYQGGDIWVIVDEFADLVTTNGRTVTPIFQRLAQIGRAAKVHVILATQCTLSTVIKTEIKCNFDARFGLRTRSASDSRNVIGRAGLEKLPRYGQAIYMKPEGDQLVNIPYIDDAEIDRLVSYLESKQTWWKRMRKRA